MLKMKKSKIITLIAGFIVLSGYSQSLSDDIDISEGYYGVIPMPATAPAAYHTDNFVKYTKIQCPNGEAIHFVAQDDISDAQIIRARTLMEFYLTNVPGSVYGADKTAVINQLGTNEAILLLINGSDDGSFEATVFGQPLYKNEMAVEGHSWYHTNDYEHRDASFEEILPLMHDMGIGVDGGGGMPGALPAYQTEIRAAQVNAALDDFAIWPIGADGTDPGIESWYTELSAENSLTQEYLASVIDSYYGLWEAWEEDPTTGMWGIYKAHNRAEIETEDPFGWALLPKYFSPFINVDMIIDPSFEGVFSMTNDPAAPYTHKSQYLQHCYLTGTNNAGFKGNAEYNRLKGNSGNNSFEGLKGNDRLDGKGGSNTAIFTGPSSDYTIVNFDTYATVSDGVEDRDGIDTLWNMHHLQFSDELVDITLESSVTSLIEKSKKNTVLLFPNPTTDYVNVELNSEEPSNLKIWSIRGELIFEMNEVSNTIQIDVSDFPNGTYLIGINQDNGMNHVKFIKK
jgi:hypothetical protein